MLSSQEEQIERRRTFAQDQSVRAQATTMHAFAQADAQTPRGRFSAVETATVIGSKAGIASSYSACSSALAVQLPDEPPLGLDNPALEPARPDEAQATDGPAGPSAPLDVERAGPSLSHSGDMTADGEQSRSQSDGYVRSPDRPYRRF
jgi:hypothetical protein